MYVLDTQDVFLLILDRKKKKSLNMSKRVEAAQIFWEVMYFWRYIFSATDVLGPWNGKDFWGQIYIY